MPSLREWRYLRFGETAELVAHQIMSRVAKRTGPSPLFRDQFGKPRHRRIGSAMPSQEHHLGTTEGAQRVLVERQIVGSRDFDLAHRDPALELRQIFAEADLHGQRRTFAERAGLR